jgi:hypothetical protein
MAGLTGNQCTIITIIPMEVECNVTNASTPTASDGSAIVQVFGGTPPYSITWNNGQQGNTLTNLLPGTYSATVVDYFGDYVVTTECVVESASQVVYQFNSCPGFATQTIYVSGSTYAPPFPLFKPTIIFNEILGCYDFIGPVNSSGLEVSGLTISNSYTNCTVCNPPTPTPPTQDTLCLTGTDDISTIQYEFTPDGIDSNGNFKWINTANGLTLTYNVTNGWWEVLTWDSLGSSQPYFGWMRQNDPNPSLQPLGNWFNVGNAGGQKWSWNMSSGPCSAIPLTLTIQTVSPQCEGQDGVAIMSANNGTPPYQYNIVGITSLQSSGQFSNVNLSQSNSFVGQVTDSLGNTATSNFTINSGSAPTNYTLLLTKSNSVVTNSNNEQVSSYDYNVTINPPTLPSGLQILFDLDFSHIRTSTYPDNLNSNPISYENTFTGSLDGNTITINSGPLVVLGSPPSQNCPESQIDVATFNSTATSISIDNTSTFNGSVSTTVTLPGTFGTCSCPITGVNKTIVQLKNIRILGATTCTTIDGNSGQIFGESTQSGCLPLP